MKNISIAVFKYAG